MPVRMVADAGLRIAIDQTLAGSAVGLPVGDHLFQVGDQQVGRGGEILRRGGRNCRRCRSAVS